MGFPYATWEFVAAEAKVRDTEMYFFFLKHALARYISGLEHCPDTPRLWVQSPVRAHIRTNKCIHKWKNE